MTTFLRAQELSEPRHGGNQICRTQVLASRRGGALSRPLVKSLTPHPVPELYSSSTLMFPELIPYALGSCRHPVVESSSFRKEGLWALISPLGPLSSYPVPAPRPGPTPPSCLSPCLALNPSLKSQSCGAISDRADLGPPQKDNGWILLFLQAPWSPGTTPGQSRWQQTKLLLVSSRSPIRRHYHFLARLAGCSNSSSHQSLGEAAPADAKAQASGLPHHHAPSHHRPVSPGQSEMASSCTRSVATLAQADPGSSSRCPEQHSSWREAGMNLPGNLKLPK